MILCLCTHADYEEIGAIEHEIILPGDSLLKETYVGLNWLVRNADEPDGFLEEIIGQQLDSVDDFTTLEIT